ncbi:hypothetical protein AMELA_G00126060 [Ameiurus melas]|uniref:Uncharacterized protein n=1 Tax=Ameiurus melas TaxID=219545 RepID=A0A7J6ARU4_AMEME|nr:hypothetical protein AMELA_G00126060 [Ameiurus melas]
MAVYRNGDAEIVSIPDNVDEIRFMNKASGSSVEPHRVRVENPVLGLSNLVNKIGAPEFKNKLPHDRLTSQV